MSWNYNYTQLNKIITCFSHNVFLKKFNTSPPPKIVSLVLTWTGASFLISCVFLCKKKIIIKNKIMIYEVQLKIKCEIHILGQLTIKLHIILNFI